MNDLLSMFFAGMLAGVAVANTARMAAEAIAIVRRRS
jgi:hypothetical protein